jgi:hypothetical protein
MLTKKTFSTIILLLLFYVGFAQVKVSGVVKDEKNQTIPFANILFSGSNIGTVSDENGKFYLEADKTYNEIIVSFIGYETKKIPIKSREFNITVTLKEEASELKEVFIYAGKVKKKGNPAIAILEKVWEKKRQNGIYLFDQYQYEKYEKLEFDINNVDSATINSKLFENIEFIFEGIDTSRVTGKAFLPIFINESVYQTYGDNTKNRIREDIVANINSGFSTNQNIIAFIKDLYVEYDIYSSYIKIFDKSFVSPISKAGTLSYNYVLADSAFIENKWCYNILYYPRRKGELTFKGDFWVNDTTFAVKEINMQANKSANINWVKDIYIEQEYDVLNDTVFLLKRDFMMSDFSFGKKEKSKGIYGKRTTMYQDYVFNNLKSDKFYKDKVNTYNEDIYNKGDEFWNIKRQEKLTENEQGIYKMIDTLKTVPKFKRLQNLASVVGSGYVELKKYNVDLGPLYSTVGQNDVEGFRLRLGGRTYFGPNDKWRVQSYIAYGFKDDQFKYGFSTKWMFDQRSRATIGGGTKRDIDQIGVSLTTSNDILGQSFASSAIFATGDTGKLTSINLTTLFFSVEPIDNLIFKIGSSYRTLKSASQDTFNLDWWVDKEAGIYNYKTIQSEIDFTIKYTPNRKNVGWGVERNVVSSTYTTLYLSYTQGLKGVFDSDFDYQKIQFYYRQPLLIGGFGRMFATLEAGKTFGEVPLGLLSIVPGNQSYLLVGNTFSLLEYYEFITDTYASVHIDHNFNGRFFSRLPFIRKLNLRELVGIKAVWGSISQENIDLSASNIPYVAPTKPYYEYSVGIGNIFKVLRVDFAWRGNYRDVPGATNFGVKASAGVHF